MKLKNIEHMKFTAIRNVLISYHKSSWLLQTILDSLSCHKRWVKTDYVARFREDAWDSKLAELRLLPDAETKIKRL